MTDIITDGKTKVWIVDSIASATLAVVTTAELTAGQAIEGFMTPDGLVGFEPETADVDNSSLASTFDTRRAGRASFSNTALRLKKQTGTDALYDELVRGFNTHVVVRRGIDVAVAASADQEIEVYPIECGEVRNLPPEANTVQRYEVPTKITAQPNLRASITAGA